MGALDVAISGQERATKVVLTTVHSEFLRVAVSVVARLSWVRGVHCGSCEKSAAQLLLKRLGRRKSRRVWCQKTP